MLSGLLSAALSLLLTMQVTVQGSDDVRKAIEEKYLPEFERASQAVNANADILVKLVDEMKNEVNALSGAPDDECSVFVGNLTKAEKFAQETAAAVIVMARNMSGLIDQLVDCFSQNETTPTPPPSVKNDGQANGNITDPCPKGSNDTVCEFNNFLACLGQPVSDTLDCLGEKLDEMEALRKACAADLAKYEQGTAAWLGTLYTGLKLCLFEPGPTKAPGGAAASILASPFTISAATLLLAARPSLQ